VFHLIASAVWIGVAWKWGDWRNWRAYYATILYLVACDLLYNVLTDGHPLWIYTKTVIPNHTLTSLLVMFVIYPCTLLVYLGHFPIRGRLRKVLYILTWALLWFSIECVLYFLHLIRYDNGWSVWVSLPFNLVIFSMLNFHQRHPLRAVVLSAVLVVILLNLFHVQVGQLD
jgi:hypothetical protein